MRHCFFGGMVCLFLAATALPAGIITQTENFAFDPAAGGQLIQFDQFDTRAGRRTLVAVELYLQIQEELNLNVENYSASACSARVEVKFNSYLLDSGGLNWKIPSFTCTAGPVWLMAANKTAGCGPDYCSLGTVSTQLRTYIYPFSDIPSGVVGRGLYGITLNSKPQTQVSGVQLYSLAADQKKTSGSVTIVYHYGPVPEPSPLILLMAGVLGLIKFRKIS